MMLLYHVNWNVSYIQRFHFVMIFNTNVAGREFKLPNNSSSILTLNTTYFLTRKSWNDSNLSSLGMLEREDKFTVNLGLSAIAHCYLMRIKLRVI